MPSVWAIADLHLSFGVPGKEMDPFGPQWHAHGEKIKAAWIRLIAPDDLVLIAGDISWGMTPDEALPDLLWIDALPGTKVVLRGNHDFWWSSLSKVQKILPPSIHLIQNNCFVWNGISIGGARLWDSPEYSFKEWIEYQENPLAKKNEPLPAPKPGESEREMEKIFARELLRLEMSLKSLPASAHRRIAMTHYPPIGGHLHPSRAAALFEKYKIEIVLFGHLHNTKQHVPLFGTKNGISYILTSADYLNFIPLKII